MNGDTTSKEYIKLFWKNYFLLNEIEQYKELKKIFPENGSVSLIHSYISDIEEFFKDKIRVK